MELLAPAGSPEALQAAVQAGADAVYLGCGPLNARQNAKNFPPEALPEAVAYCHLRGVKVYLTMNTLLTTGSWPRPPNWGLRPVPLAWTPSWSRTWGWPSSCGSTAPTCPSTAPPR